MATAPAFASTINNLPVKVSATADTSYTAPSVTVVIFTAGATGSVVTEVVIMGNGTTIQGKLTLFIKRSGTFYLVDEFLIPVVTPNTTTVVGDVMRTSRAALDSTSGSVP